MRTPNIRFATIVFYIAGIWGLVIVAPMYFLYDVVGRAYPPPITHADFYYGFVSVTLVWQLAFLLIGTNPVRFRPFMVAAILEKFGYVATLGVLLAQGRVHLGQFVVVSPDSVLGALFIAALIKTSAAVSDTTATTTVG
jgi:hypothetical protein